MSRGLRPSSQETERS